MMADAAEYIGWRRAASITTGLVSTAVVNTAGGFAFWWLAARLYPTSAVGLAAAALSATLLLGQIAELGLGTHFAGELHREPRRRDLLTSGLIACSIAGFVIGLCFIMLGPFLSAELAPLSSTPLAVGAFTLGVSLAAATSVLDQVLSATLHGAARVARNVAFVISRLALLPIGAFMFGSAAIAVIGSSTAGLAVSLLVFPIFVHRPLPVQVRGEAWSKLRSFTSVAMWHHAVNLSRSAGVWIMPLIVTIIVSAEATAPFYVALMLSNATSLIGSAAAFTLYVMGTRTPHLVDEHLRFTFGVATISAAIGSFAIVLFGPLVMAAFGESYASSGDLTLAFLALTALPLVVRDQWLGIQRVTGRVRLAAVAGVATLLLELFASALGALSGGTEGLAALRLVALSVLALIMLPQLRSVSDRTSQSSAS